MTSFRALEGLGTFRWLEASPIFASLGWEETMGGPIERRKQLSSVQFALGGTTRSVDVAVFPDAHLPYDYILGAGALADATLEVDFDQAHLCVTAK